MRKGGRGFSVLGFGFLGLIGSVCGQLGGVGQGAGVKPRVVFLGTYHMGTPGHNIVNGTVDDITSVERQGQVEELVAKLKRFRPTKVVLECDLEDTEKRRGEYESI